MKFNIVYGNHEPLTHMEDYFRLLHGALCENGHSVSTAVGPLPGCVNLIFERYEDAVAEQMVALMGKAEYVLLATEFLTGDTFNDFSNPAPSGEAPGAPPANVPRLNAASKDNLGSAIRNVFAHAIPSSIKAILKAGIWRHKMVRARQAAIATHGDPYAHTDFWKVRFQGFMRMLSMSRAIWCVDPTQESAYRELVGDSMPVGSMTLGYQEGFVPTVARTEPRYDFLFTGTMTDHRFHALTDLRKAGYQVHFTPPINPGFLREIHTGSSRFTLGLKQNPGWRYPSTLRNYYYLMAGSPFLAERTEVPSYLDPYIFVSESDNFIEYCKAKAEESPEETRRQTDEKREAFRAEPHMAVHMKRLVEQTLDSTS